MVELFSISVLFRLSTSDCNVYCSLIALSFVLVEETV